jgi:hypothetical protein
MMNSTVNKQAVDLTITPTLGHDVNKYSHRRRAKVSAVTTELHGRLPELSLLQQGCPEVKFLTFVHSSRRSTVPRLWFQPVDSLIMTHLANCGLQACQTVQKFRLTNAAQCKTHISCIFAGVLYPKIKFYIQALRLGKVIPGQVLRVARGSGSPILKQSAHEDVTVVSPTQRPPLLPRKYS